jgi:predicted nucleic acid-binding protein
MASILGRGFNSPRLHHFVSSSLIERSPDPTDDFLLALSEAGKADYLVTGDKTGLLALARHQATRIISARDFMALFA